MTASAMKMGLSPVAVVLDHGLPNGKSPDECVKEQRLHHRGDCHPISSEMV